MSKITEVQVKAAKLLLRKAKEEQPKAKANPKTDLVNFMKSKGYKLTKEVKATYVNKAKETIPVKKLSFSNGKDYMVGASRFWTVR